MNDPVSTAFALEQKSGFELEINKFDIYRDNYGYRLI